MKQHYLLYSLLVSLFSNAQIINFPDSNFKAKLLQPNVAIGTNFIDMSIDTNNDGEIDMEEAAAVFGLYVSDANITDLTGISSFVNLKILDCHNNLLTHLTIDNSIEIYKVNANHNQLSSVDVNFVTGFSDLETGIDLSYNNLTTFSISDCILWGGLNLQHNQLVNLEISNCEIIGFWIDYNNLTSIDFTGNNSIYSSAGFTHNQFTVLDLAGVDIDFECQVYLGNNVEDRVRHLYAGDIYYRSNKTFFDLGDYQGTTSCDPQFGGHINLHYCPNLETVNFKNGYNHMFITCDEGGDAFQNPSISLSISNCPNLTTLCVDPPEINTFQYVVNMLGLQSQITVNPNCDSLLVTDTPLNQFTLSPVPAHDILHLQYKDGQVIQSVAIYNALGQLVQKEIGNQHLINVASLAKGSYFLKATSEEGTSTVRQFLKE